MLKTIPKLLFSAIASYDGMKSQMKRELNLTSARLYLVLIIHTNAIKIHCIEFFIKHLKKQ